MESPSLEIFQTRLDTVLCSLLWVTLLGQGVGLGDPQRALPTPNMLGFWDWHHSPRASPQSGGLTASQREQTVNIGREERRDAVNPLGSAPTAPGCAGVLPRGPSPGGDSLSGSPGKAGRFAASSATLMGPEGAHSALPPHLPRAPRRNSPTNRAFGGKNLPGQRPLFRE